MKIFRLEVSNTMKNKLMKTLSVGLSSLMITLMMVAVTTKHTGSASALSTQPKSSITLMEDPPW